MRTSKREVTDRADSSDTIGPCRFCRTPLKHTFVDLGMSPLCESFRTAEQQNQMERFYPLHVYICEKCFLVQLLEYVAPKDIFTDYAYFSSYSTSWLQHARKYVEMIIDRFGLSQRSRVVELASNDGYLLRNFVSRGIPAIGVEPAANVAQVAIDNGIPTVIRFFGVNTAEELLAEGGSADLIVGNNVLAHVPDINDFVGGIQILLAPDGVVTMEFPHLLQLMESCEFDTIYHEHFSYLSFSTVDKIFAAHRMRLFDVQELPSHGGSLRIFGCHQNSTAHHRSASVDKLLERESSGGMKDLGYYRAFEEQVKEAKRKLLEFLIRVRREAKNVAGYGAPGKGNTLLNYCGIRTDFIDYVVDRNPHKHGKFLPGTGIPIFPPERIKETKPDYILILPWNLQREIAKQLAYVREWGGQLLVPVPEARIIS